MKLYSCDHCGARIKNKQPSLCPLCGEHEFSLIEETVSATDEKERKLVEDALDELDEYTKGCEPYDPHYYNNGE